MAGCCDCDIEHLGSISAGISWLAENWLAFQEGLCCMELLITESDWHQVRSYDAIVLMFMQIPK